MLTFYAHNAYAQNSAADLEVRILKGSSNENLAKSLYPEILPIEPNDSITWTNEDSVTHSITSGVPANPEYSGKYFKTGNIKPGVSVTTKIDNPIYYAYYYFCEIHPWLEGKIILASAPEAEPDSESAKISEKTYAKGQDIVLSGEVVQDFAEITYDVLVYQHPDKLVDIKHGRFENAQYIQTIPTDNLHVGKYTLKVLYGLPTQVATVTFDLNEGQNVAIPQWIKENARWWSAGSITDGEFIDAIEYLAKEKIITVQKTNSGEQSESIPTWIKTNAAWWADSMITDKEFARGLQYLANSGIIRL
jgi:plastocyanin